VTAGPYAVRLQQLLQLFGLAQHVNEPTHSAGHTLNLVRSDTVIIDLHVGGMVSDYALVLFSLPPKK